MAQLICCFVYQSVDSVRYVSSTTAQNPWVTDTPEHAKNPLRSSSELFTVLFGASCVYNTSLPTYLVLFADHVYSRKSDTRKLTMQL